MKSRLAGGIELFTKSAFVLSSGKTFEIVAEATPIENYFGDSEDIRRINFAHLASEMITKLIPENHPAPELYNALEYALANESGLSTDMLELFLISKITYLLGIYPELNVCLDCREKPTGKVSFSHTAGGIFCHDCAPHAESFEIERDTVKLWRYLLASDSNNLKNLRIEDEVVLETLVIARNYIAHTTSSDYHSLNYTH